MNKIKAFFKRYKAQREELAKLQYQSLLHRMYNIRKCGPHIFIMCDGEPVFKCAPEMTAEEIIAKVTQMQHDKETYDKIKYDIEAPKDTYLNENR